MDSGLLRLAAHLGKYEDKVFDIGLKFYPYPEVQPLANGACELYITLRLPDTDISTAWYDGKQFRGYANFLCPVTHFAMLPWGKYPPGFSITAPQNGAEG